MIDKKSPEVTIYTDGACLNNPGPGGWAALVITKQGSKELVGGEKRTTNNRMELTAALEALRSLRTPSKVNVYTDSMYLRRGITEWMPNWRKRNWKRKGGKLANADLWQELDKMTRVHKIHWHWVRGHSSNKYNNHVDRLARKAINQVLSGKKRT